MPHKKTKADKSKKPGKHAKPVAKAAKGGVGEVLKKAAKNIANKTVGNLAKKGLPPSAQKKAGKPAPAKKPLQVKSKVDLAKKDKKAGKHAPLPPPPPQKHEKGGKKKAEVVVELPAPKGVALLGRDKKKAKSADAAASGKRRCREPGCDHEAQLNGYCRLHYIKNWRKIKRKEAILASGQLNNYVEELVNKYPDKYLDVIRQDLASEKEWAKVVVDLELESSEEDAAGEEELDAVAEGVRPAAGGRGEFEGDDEGF